MARWTPGNLPDLKDRIAVVTGANSGIGLEATLELARHGATTVLACRNPDKARDAVARVQQVATGPVETLALDLADLKSVRRAAAELASRHPAVHLLVNNAGVMALPYRKTADGFEMQFGTNHLGHFALTGLVLPLLRAAGDARVVNVSSLMHRPGRIRFDDLQGEKRYSRWAAYAQSKLANLLFTFELQRRLASAGLPVKAIACHPGYSATNLQTVAAKMEGSSVQEKLNELANRVVAQPAAMGALPTLFACGEPSLKGGEFIGPDGWFEVRGHPKCVDCSARAKDTETARRLWETSERLTGVTFEFPVA